MIHGPYDIKLGLLLYTRCLIILKVLSACVSWLFKTRENMF
jgi:hypothetical protein